MPQQNHILSITTDSVSQRLDNFILKQNRRLPKSLIYKSIRNKSIRVNGRKSHFDYRLVIGDEVSIPHHLLSPQEKKQDPNPKHSKVQCDVLWEDDHYLIVDKPSGLAVHAGSGIHENLMDSIQHPGIYLAHRLDRKTSGCVVLAKNRTSLLAFQDQLQNGLVEKTYTAITYGHWDHSRQQYEWKQPLKRIKSHTSKRAVVVDDSGKPTLTIAKLERSKKKYHQLILQPKTGRMHQLRVHCAHAQLPILGDDIYGNHHINRIIQPTSSKNKPMYLHASSITFQHPERNKPLTVTSPLPKHFQEFQDHI